MPIHALLVRCERGTGSNFVYVPCLEIENDFKIKIQEYVSKFDSEKAVLLAQLEKELNVRQELILESARKRIDDLNEEANRLKMVVFDVCSLPFHTPVIGFFQGVLREAQAQSNAKISRSNPCVIPSVDRRLV